MVYNIIVGRTESDKKKFGDKGAIFLGKTYVKMGRTTSLSNNIFLDVARSHVVMVCGKRGSGKSYSLSVIAEGIANLPQEVSENLSVLIFDTMGVFWTMKYPNEKDEELLENWNLKKKGLDINLVVPEGSFKKYKDLGIPADSSFSIKPNQLTADDWILSFGLKYNDPVSIAIQKILYDLEEMKIKDYSIDDLIDLIKKDETFSIEIKNSTINNFKAAKRWGLFSKKGTKIKDILKPGKVTVLDISAYTTELGGWNVKNLVIGLASKNLFIERMKLRKKEEMEVLKEGYSYFKTEKEVLGKEAEPLVWLILDEAHEALPLDGKTAATEALVTILREGRQPGVSLILATQQPGKIHHDVMTQSDIVLSHRLTAKPDIEALNMMMQSYMLTGITKHINELPKEKGSAIILDDNSERIFPLRVRPKFSWHGGEAPTAVKSIKRYEL